MSQLERTIENNVCKWVKKHGGLAIKLSPVSTSGLPDRMFLLPRGVVCFIEFKAPGEKPTPIQRYFHRTFADLGFPVHVADNYDDAIKILDAARIPAASDPADDAAGSSWPFPRPRIRKD